MYRMRYPLWHHESHILAAAKGEDIVKSVTKIIKIMKNSIGVEDNLQCAWAYEYLAKYYLEKENFDKYFEYMERAIFFNNSLLNILVYTHHYFNNLKKQEKYDSIAHLGAFIGTYLVGLEDVLYF